MNILFVDQFSEPGGAQLALIDLLPAVRERGWHACVAAPGNGLLTEWCGANGIRVYPLPLRTQSNGRKTARDAARFAADLPRMHAMLREIVRREAIDLVYVNGPRVLPAAIAVRVPVIFHAHSDVQSKWGERLRRWAIRAARARVIAVSEYAARDLPGATVIYNGVEDRWNGERVFGGRQTRIAILGRIAPEKGHLDFVRAARLMAGAARFSVYGDANFSKAGYADAVRREAAGVPIEFHGWQYSVTEVLSQVDILAVPSFEREASTRVIIEAFSAGVPVVAYPSGGIPELIQHGVTGILTESRDPGELARCLGDLRGNPERMRAISTAGRLEWQRRFTRGSFRQAICAVIETEFETRHSGHDRAALRDSERRRGSTRRDARDPVR